jgi:hypothetical protein
VDKVDLKTQLPAYRAPRGRYEIVDVPDADYLMVDGAGDPNTSPAYADALAALYPVAYALKFASRHELERDYVVPPLEGLWWADDMSTFTTARDKTRWSWTMMLMVPEWVPATFVDDAVARVREKGAPARLDDVRLARLSEGRCVQTLHVGSYDDEAPILDRMHREFIPAHDLRLSGTHHEIYLSDARRVAPEKLRTILRQPVAGLTES